MNPNQQTFLREYLRTGDKITAYRLAYPKAKQTSLKSAVNRLLRTNPAIAKAVHDKRLQLDKQAEAEVKAEQKKKYITKDRLRTLLADVIEGREINERIYKTRDGIERIVTNPSVSNKLTAANACIRLEGWAHHNRPAKTKQPKEEKKPAEPKTYDIYIGGMPMHDYTALFDDTLNAYYDKEDGTWRSDPDNNHTRERFLEVQSQREKRKNAERQARMTPQLQREEDMAMRDFEKRVVDEELYTAQSKLIDTLRDDYLETKDETKLKELKATQKLCGLRFLHHRHRYEAEREAGWEFHPLNNNLIRRAPSGSPLGRSVRASKTAPKRQHPETSGESPNQGSPVPFAQCHPECNEGSPEPMQQAKPEPPPTPAQLREQGYKPMSELMQDEWDYYIHNQGSTTWQQLKQLERFIAGRNSSPAEREQIERDTGWFYHPQNPAYGKRDPARPLVRTVFKSIR